MICRRYMSLVLTVFFLSLFFQSNVTQAQDWIHSGPYGAAVTALETDPFDSNYIYLGTQKHGIFISDDYGSTWHDANEGIQLYEPYDGTNHWLSQRYNWVWLIKAHPSVPGFLWASLMLDGLYYTDNYGDEWHMVEGEFPNEILANTISCDPFDSQHIITGGNFGLYESNDCGISFTEIESIQGSISASSYSPEIEDYLIVSINGEGLLISDDGGEAWDTMRTSKWADKIFFNQQNPDSLITLSKCYQGAGIDKSLDLSTDGGLSWNEIELMPENYSIYSLHYAGFDRLYFACTSGIFTSNNFGETWSLVINNPPSGNESSRRYLTHLSSNIQRGESIFYGNRYGIYNYNLANDENNSMNNPGLDNTLIIEIIVDPNDNRNCIAGGEQGLWKTNDGGDSWTTLDTDFVFDVKIDQIHPDTIYWGGENLRRSFDGGNTWIEIDNDGGEFVTGIAIHPVETNTIYFSTIDYVPEYYVNDFPRYFRYSEDYGDSWNTVGLDFYPQKLETIDAYPERVYLNCIGGLYYTSDNGITWHNIIYTNNLDIEISNDSQYIYCITYNEYSNGLIVSTDGGITTIARETPGFAEDMLDIAINPSDNDHVILATERGLYSSADAGDSWIFIHGDYEKPTTKVEFSADGSTVYTGTYGFGVYKSDNYLGVGEEGNQDKSELPQEYDLVNVFPNPFNMSTRIRVKFSKAEESFLHIYNINGQLVKSFNIQPVSTGYHDITWNGTDNNGSQLTSGIYFVQFTDREKTEIHKIVLIK